MEIEKLISRFGKPFYSKVLSDLKIYSNKWALTSFQFIPSYSANVVFKCYSEDYGDVVLKIGNPSNQEIITEFHTLNEYNGNRFCKVLEVDLHNGVILEECVQPGLPLRNEKSLDKRISVFCSLFHELHKAPERAGVYPTYTDWVSQITEYMSKRHDCSDLYLHMKNAKDLCSQISAMYSQKMLLHGDFHHDNILLDHTGDYIVIDPKGVIGDPVFDVPRFILNEFEDEISSDLYIKIKHVINSLEEKLHIPNIILKKCLYIETAMGACWSVESGETPDEFPKLLDNVAFAESIFNE